MKEWKRRIFLNLSSEVFQNMSCIYWTWLFSSGNKPNQVCRTSIAMEICNCPILSNQIQLLLQHRWMHFYITSSIKFMNCMSDSWIHQFMNSPVHEMNSPVHELVHQFMKSTNQFMNFQKIHELSWFFSYSSWTVHELLVHELFMHCDHELIMNCSWMFMNWFMNIRELAKVHELHFNRV